MPTKNQNSTKQLIFRSIAVTITLCYILGPAHVQINEILHTISHNLSVPSYVFQHDADQNSEHINQLNSGTNLSSNQLTHHHEILDFIDTIFDAESNQDKRNNSESLAIDFKINKHIVTDTYFFADHNIIKIEKPIFGSANSLFKKRYLDQLFRPPKV